MIDWTRNPALEEELYARLRHKYVQDRTHEIHFSDTLYCLTKAYWNKVDPIPVDNDTLGLFAIGFALEEVILKTPPSLRSIEQTIRKGLDSDFTPLLEIVDSVHALYTNPVVESYVYEGVHFSPDYTMTAMSGEMDLKSTRMWEEKGGDGRPKLTDERPHGFPETWLKQFMGYAYRLGATLGATCKHPGTYPENGCTTCFDDDLEALDYVDYSVAIMYLGPGKLIAGTIRFGWDEVELNMAQHLHRASILEDQLAQQAPPTPFMYNDQWECKNCPYLSRCQQT